MAILIIKKDNQVMSEMALDTSKEYVAGRSKECDIQLSEIVISRKHFRLFYKNNKWNVQSISKYSPIFVNNEPVDFSELNNKDEIQLVQYQFIFLEEEVELALENTQALHKEPAYSEPNILDEKTTDPGQDQWQNSPRISEIETDEKTFVPASSSQNWSIGAAYLIIDHPETPSQTLRLEGEYWILGREETCDIIIDDPKSSREHCEIIFESGSYFLIDKNSSNGTYLNQKKLLPEKKTKIISGDQILIGKVSILFEVRDPLYQEKLSHLPVAQEPQAHMEYLHQNSYQKVKRIDDVKPKKSPLFYGILGVLTVLIIYGLTDTEKESHLASQDPSKTLTPISTDPLEALSPEQKDIVERSYNLANSLFGQGKYELALIEVEKVLALVPDYKDIKEIRKFASVGLDTHLEQQEIQRQEEQQRNLKVKVEQMLNQCEVQFNKNKNSDSLENCLIDVIAFDPANPKIEELRSLASKLEADKIRNLANKQAFQAQVQKRKELFSRAESLKQRGKILDAISAHNRNIASTLPDPENLEAKSRREVKELQEKIEKDIQNLTAEAEKAYSSKNYREAIELLEKAIQLNPQSARAKSLHSNYSKELFKIVKTLYGDSVLEENLGNIESAKEKWKKIQDIDVKYGEYFKKANSKLKKYGL